jgi:hypothetical protein
MKWPSKSCDLDPLPTWLLKKHLQIFLPILTTIVNTSLLSGSFPAELRKAKITLVLKKISLDKQQLSNYRPVSNLAFLGKLIEKVVSAQVTKYVDVNHLAEPLQSAYRGAHSTETALLSVHNTLLRALDDNKAVFVVLLDLTAAFDTVDHCILLQRLSQDFGLAGAVHDWFKSYLQYRSSQVYVKGCHSNTVHLSYGVPQGSVIGPLVFTYYTHVIGHIIRTHGLQYHLYADDVQLIHLFDPTCPGDAACGLFKLTNCIRELQSWLTDNKLKLNMAKTEFFIASSALHYKNLKHHTLYVDELEIPVSSSIKNLGVVFDNEMKMSDHITHLARSLNWQIRNLCKIRRFLDFNACNNAVRALILSRMDYCCSLLNGITRKNLTRLQRIQNKCARLIFMEPKYTHTSPLLERLHWLPVAKRIQFRTLVHTFNILASSTPDYLASILHTHQSVYSLRSTSGTSLTIPRAHKQAGDRAFSIIAPVLWNGLYLSPPAPPPVSLCSKII